MAICHLWLRTALCNSFSAQRQAVACRQIQQTMIPMTSVHLPCFMEAGCKAQSSILSMFDQLINSTQP
jgi:hypothetical protein